MSKMQKIWFAILASLVPVFALNAQTAERPVQSNQEFAASIRATNRMSELVLRTALDRNGRWLATTEEGHLSITEVTEKGRGAITTVQLPDSARACGNSTWSPTGDALALRCQATFGYAPERLYVWHRGATQLRLASGPLERESPLRWTSDGRRIVYVSQREVEEEPQKAAPATAGRGGPIAEKRVQGCPVMGPLTEVAAVECSDSVEAYRSLGYRRSADRRRAVAPVGGYERIQVKAFDLRTGEESLLATVRMARVFTRNSARIIPTEDGSALLVSFPTDAGRQKVAGFMVRLDQSRTGEPLVFGAALEETARDSRITRITSSVANQFLQEYRKPEGSLIVLSPDGRAAAWTGPGESVDLYAPMLAIDTLFIGATDGSEQVRALILDGSRVGADSARMLVRRREAIPPVWTPGGRNVLVIASGQLWTAEREGGMARRLQAPNGREVHHILSSTDRRVLVATIDLLSGRHGVWRVELASGKWLRVMEEDQSLARVEGVETPDGEVSLAYVASSFQSPPNVFARLLPAGKQDLTAARQITNFTIPIPLPAVESKAVSYRIGDDRFGMAVLVRPAGARGPLPTVVHAYPFARTVVATRNRPCLGDFDGAVALHCSAVARGWAVLLVDVPLTPDGVYGPRGAVQDMIEPVLAALDAATRTGWVDTTRLAVAGHSQGGYMVNSLVVHTTRFRAAASLSGISNAVSQMVGGAGHGREWVYSGPLRMEVPISEDPLRYIRESPAAYIENVTTPLLLITGSKDLHVHHTQSEEMFRGLAQLGKTTEFVKYKHADHADQWYLDAAYTRALDWFARWFAEERE